MQPLKWICYKGAYHLGAEPFANNSVAVRRNDFHEEPNANHEKGANPFLIINHRLSVANGTALEYALVCRFHLAGSKEVRGEQ
ncbi:hypothetical protein AVEN_53613-1 [Araneus ventricosus]|uniref:Uncharacterized protein n=1 Tax=Araneus ventricosus TaxID=182803 RepID=A0A4Y2UNV1_ARAVE|nr:hypothetical protein AVEN_53613-1 [Araneus ventricosus]